MNCRSNSNWRRWPIDWRSESENENENESGNGNGKENENAVANANGSWTQDWPVTLRANGREIDSSGSCSCGCFCSCSGSYSESDSYSGYGSNCHCGCSCSANGCSTSQSCALDGCWPSMTSPSRWKAMESVDGTAPVACEHCKSSRTRPATTKRNLFRSTDPPMKGRNVDHRTSMSWLVWLLTCSRPRLLRIAFGFGRIKHKKGAFLGLSGWREVRPL